MPKSKLLWGGLWIGGALLLFQHCAPAASPAASRQVPDSLYRMMRLRTAEMKALRRFLQQNAGADSIRARYFPFDFTKGIPSEGMVLEPVFPFYAEAFSKRYEAFYQHPSAENYNRMVQVCQGCHEAHCPGPLRLIRRLYLPAQD